MLDTKIIENISTPGFAYTFQDTQRHIDETAS
jgi:hypothetical protein